MKTLPQGIQFHAPPQHYADSFFLLFWQKACFFFVIYSFSAGFSFTYFHFFCSALNKNSHQYLYCKKFYITFSRMDYSKNVPWGKLSFRNIHDFSRIQVHIKSPPYPELYYNICLTFLLSHRLSFF